MSELVLDARQKKARSKKHEWVLILGDLVSFTAFQLVFMFKFLSWSYTGLLQISVLLVGITYLVVYPYIFRKRRDKRASNVLWMGRVIFLGPLTYYGIFSDLVATEFAQVSSLMMMGLLIYCMYKVTDSKSKLFWVKWSFRAMMIGVPGATFLIFILLNIGA